MIPFPILRLDHNNQAFGMPKGMIIKVREATFRLAKA
jgi:hypothetical protein